MELPILNYTPPISPGDLVRHYHKLAHDFTAALAEPEPIDVGVAFCNAELVDVPEANAVFDAALPPHATASATVDATISYFAERHVEPLRWVMNPSATVAQTAPLLAELTARGYARQSTDILHLSRRVATGGPDAGRLMIIPARSAFAHAQQLATESSAGHAGAAAAVVQHLDEPRFDALLALQDGRAVARIGVLAVGELGLIEQLYVSPAERGRGIDALMLSRALDFCTRSGFKHVLVGADDAQRPLFMRNGFEGVGAFVQYVLPTTR